jgi:hypothetical protein
MTSVTRQRLDGTFSATPPRRRHQPAAANISITNVAGSGAVAFALATEPLPPGSPKLVRHVSYPVGPIAAPIISNNALSGLGTLYNDVYRVQLFGSCVSRHMVA